MAWGADDYGGNVFSYPTYRESDPLFDRFIRRLLGTLCCESYYVVCFESDGGIVPHLPRPMIDKSVPRVTPLSF